MGLWSKKRLWSVILLMAVIQTPITEARLFKILQLNAWQLRVLNHEVTDDRLDRLKLIPKYVADTESDVIAFTEVWKNKAKDEISMELEKLGYPYSSYHRRVLLGDGLLLVSKFPITDVQYSKTFFPKTRPDEIIANKRARRITLTIPEVGDVDVYQAHMGAVTFHVDQDEYDVKQEASLLKQFKILADFVRTSATSKRVILAADLNAHYQAYAGGRQFYPKPSENYELLTSQSCKEGYMENSFLDSNHMTIADHPRFTYDDANPYVSKGYFSGIPSEVEDYILNCPTNKIRALKSTVVFNTPIPESAVEEFDLQSLPKRLSDHYGVLTEYDLKK